jgi:lysophospholipase L1-like esterase
VTASQARSIAGLLLIVACSGEPSATTPPPVSSGASASGAGSGATASGGSLPTGPSAGTAGTHLAGAGASAVAGSSDAGESGGAGASAGGGSTFESGTAGSNGNAGSGGSGGQAPQVTACAESQLSQCTGTPLACHFGGEPGNYEVTVQLAAGQNEVEAEYYRRMLTAKLSGDAWFSFVTNVRIYEGEPLRPDQDSATSKGISGLDVYFRGAMPSAKSICYRRIDKPLMLWIEGDSTVTDQEDPAYSGWGQHLPQHFLSPISVANYADSGESSGSVLSSAKLWGTIKAGMKAGDWVMLQVGHNDKQTTAAAFKSNLQKMLSDTRAAKAHMILVTPISRVGYTLAQQHVNSVGANLPQIIRDLGKAEDVPVIDLTVTTFEWLQTIKWQDYFANGTDHTHTNHQGADIVSGFVRDAVRKQTPELAAYLR